MKNLIYKKFASLVCMLGLFWAGGAEQVQGQTGTVGTLKRTGFTPVLFYKKFVAESNLNFPVNDKHKKLSIRHSSGDLKIIASSGSELEVYSTIKLTSLGKRKATRFLEKYLKIRLVDRGNRLYLKSAFEVIDEKKRLEKDIVVSSPNIGAFIANPGARIHTTVKVPPGIALDIRDGSGSIEIEGIDNHMYIRDHSGKIHLSNLGGMITVRDGAGALITENTRDSLSIRDASGKILIKECAGPVKVIDHSGEIRVTSADAFVHVIDYSGDIYLKDLSQGLDLNDHSGKISLDNIAYGAQAGQEETLVKIRDRSGAIYIKQIPNSGVEILDTSGKIIRK